MLPGLGVSEILLLGVLALLVVGPKDLPLMMRKLGKFMAKLRGMAQEFRTGFDELARQAELDELKKEVEALRRSNPINELRAPLQDLNRDLNAAVTAPPRPAAPAPALPPLPADPGPGEAPLELEANPEPQRAANGGGA